MKFLGSESTELFIKGLVHAQDHCFATVIHVVTDLDPGCNIFLRQSGAPIKTSRFRFIHFANLPQS